MRQDPYLPPGYTGVDAPSQHVYLECPQGHVWPTREHHEYGTVSFSLPECPHCGMDGEVSDQDSVCSIATKAECTECGEWVWKDDLDDDDVCMDCRFVQEQSKTGRRAG